MLVEKTSRGMSINQTVCPDRASFLALIDSLDFYREYLIQITAGVSEIIGLPASRRFLARVFRASSTVGIVTAHPQDSDPSVYKMYHTGQAWSEWITC